MERRQCDLLIHNATVWTVIKPQTMCMMPS